MKQQMSGTLKGLRKHMFSTEGRHVIEMTNCSKAKGCYDDCPYPLPLNLNQGIARDSWSKDLRDLELERKQRSLEMYWVNRPCPTLKTNNRT